MPELTSAAPPTPAPEPKPGFTWRKAVFVLTAIFCLTPLVSAPLALFLGLVMAQLVGHPYLHLNHRATQILLQVSVVGLGFGISLDSAWQAGKEGVVFSVVSIISTLVLGLLLGKWLRMDKKTSHLISAGTAICGGSAIAAIAPVIKAEEKQISVALGTVFILNSVALFVFPMVGRALHLSQHQFGVWAAIAIHDTSSVVGAASKYGAQALQIATTVKLARALWIVPVAFVSSFAFKSHGGKVKVPYFIGLFVLAMVVNSYVPLVQRISPYLTDMAKAGLTLTLFLIGSGLNRDVLRSVGVRPLIQGIVLWIVVSTAALWAVLELL